MKKFLFMISICICSFCLFPMVVCASGVDTSIMDDIDFKEIEDSLTDVLEDKTFSFQDAVLSLIQGEIPFTMENVGDIIWQGLFSGLNSQKETMVHILIIVIIASIFNVFAEIFKSSPISDISFYIIYLLLFIVMLKSFGTMTEIVTGTLSGVVEFMRAMVPAYFLVLAFASGSTSAMVFYELVLMIILVVEWVLLNVMVPAINIYVVLSMVNNLSKEDFLSKLADLIKKGVLWGCKTLTGAVIGINVVQGLISPMVDALKSTVITKTASAIPGVGNAINSVTEIVIGSAVLIKNSVGVAALIILIIICAIPLIKLAINSFLYKLLSSVIQPIADKRIAACINCFGEGVGLLLKVLFTTMVLFLITIAMVAASTNRGY